MTEHTTTELADQHFNADAETVTDAYEGAYIYTSWGYGQTNVEMAQIVDVSDSGKTVLARMVAPETVESSHGSDSLKPTGEQYGDEFRLYVRDCLDDPVFRGSYPYINGEKDEGTRKDSFSLFENREGNTVHRTSVGYRH